jgi:hypothetical protein
MSNFSKIQELQNNISKKYKSFLCPIQSEGDLSFYSTEITLFQDENFILNYNKKTETLTLETTYSNQKITDTFLEKLNFLQNISKSYFKLETE